MGPKGRGLSLFVLLHGSSITAIAADNTRGLKYRLGLKADDQLQEKDITEKMHLLHAVAVAIKIMEVPFSERKVFRTTLQKTVKGDGWGDDLRLELDSSIMVSQLNRPKNLNPEAEMKAMQDESREEAKRRGREANRAIKERQEAEIERLRKIDEAIQKGKRPNLDESDDDFEDDDSEGEEDEANDFNNQFNQKPTVVPSPKQKKIPKPKLKKDVPPPLHKDGSEGHPERLRVRKNDVRVQAWAELDAHPMLCTALYRPPTAEILLEAHDPKLDYQFRLTFKTKPPGEIEGRSKIEDEEELEEITAMLQNLIPRLKVTGANAQYLGRMSLG